MHDLLIEWLTEWFIDWLIDWSLCHSLMPQAVTSSRYKRNEILNSAQSELKRLQKALWLDLAMMLYDCYMMLSMNSENAEVVYWSIQSRHQSAIFRSLISVNSGCSLRNLGARLCVSQALNRNTINSTIKLYQTILNSFSKFNRIEKGTVHSETWPAQRTSPTNGMCPRPAGKPGKVPHGKASEMRNKGSYQPRQHIRTVANFQHLSSIGWLKSCLKPCCPVKNQTKDFSFVFPHILAYLIHLYSLWFSSLISLHIS